MKTALVSYDISASQPNGFLLADLHSTHTASQKELLYLTPIKNCSGENLRYAQIRFNVDIEKSGLDVLFGQY
jgi:hypothetical protein